MNTALVTGGTSGFGYALTEGLLDRGWKVVVVGRNLQNRVELFPKFERDFKDRFFKIDVDLENPAAANIITNWFTETKSDLNLLVNNAGFGLFGALEDLSDSQIEKQMKVNFFSPVFLCKSLLPLLSKSHGKIYNVSSTFGFVGFPLTSLYCASKFALEGFSESLDYELRPHGVRSILIEPGSFPTSFGRNIVWGENSMSANSKYVKQTQNYELLRAKLRENNQSVDTTQITDVILKSFAQKNPPQRIRIGKDSKFTWFLKKFSPENLFYRYMRMFFNYTINKGI